MKALRTFLVAALPAVACGLALTLVSVAAFAHCDTLDGPVVTEAKVALEKGDVTPVLKWVKKEHEEEVRAVFRTVLAVRSRGPEAKALADRHFFETLVRLHRAGEGEPFTGLKPAGSIEPAVAAADRAIETGSVDALARKLSQALEQGMRERLARLTKAKAHQSRSVEAGREFVAAYVDFVHYVESVHNTIAGAGAHHQSPGAKPAGSHQH